MNVTLPVNSIICGECSEVMAGWPDECIDLTVTSPPYADLRDYNGFVFEFEKVAKELYRVTKKGGVVVWVVADKTVDGDESGDSFRQALGFKEVGFRLHDTMIYSKINPIPLSHNRYEQHFEFMFVLVKGRLSTFNPIFVKTHGAGKRYSWECTNDHGQNSAKRNRTQKSITKDIKIAGNIWVMPVASDKMTNSAPFPELLAHDHIISWSNPGDLVLDPFVGSVTTPKMAAKLGRNWIGIDISEEYCQLARDRVEIVTRQHTLFG
jgi:DNA modification methylase